MKNLFKIQNVVLLVLALCSSSLAWAQTGNTFEGVNAGLSNTTGDYNSFFGSHAGKKNTTASYNSFLGYQSGNYTTSGGFNSFLGYRAGFKNTTGYRNTFFGTSTGYDNTTGFKNTFIGDQSGADVTTGKRNTFIGSESGYKNKTGSNNTFIGQRAGYTNLGTGNVCIGYFAGYNHTGSNKLYIDNSGTANPLIYGDFSANKVGINTSSVPTGYTLAVDGKAIVEELKVQLSQDWPDYVFEEEYEIMSLEEKQDFTENNKHLPSFATEAEMEAEGVSVGENMTNTVKELEEAYLYIYQLNDAVKRMESDISTVLEQNKTIVKENIELKNEIERLSK